MIRVFLNPLGRVLRTISGDIDNLNINTLGSDIYVDLSEISFDVYQHYYDFAAEAFVGLGEPPSIHHTFDYTTKQWIDPRTIDEIKAQKWAEVKQQRDRLEFGGFEFEGNIYDSDQVSQGRIMGAAVAGVDQVWTLADNTTVELSASQLQQLYQALQLHIAEVHARGRAARQLIFEAETKEQVEAVQL
ncbi:DUF4376 domain-containing protein [Acinetobacter indicus]|uniref:DUF4376 domain-containing protein n=1 Tax=Acinetobacter indicus TaxID=756892 RepID=UPI000CEC13F7|nr:DUF4376 domain-containing protein [Acinetobacter indicus]